MSDAGTTMDEQEPRTQYLTAEYKDGQLQIVEVTPYNRESRSEGDILPDLNCDGEDGNVKYNMQVMNPNKNLVQLDLLNLTLVRSENGEDSYQLVANTDSTDGSVGDDNTVTCVLQTSDQEGDQDNQFVVMNSNNGDRPLVFLQSSLGEMEQHSRTDGGNKNLPTPSEILEKAKALQRLKGLAAASPMAGKRRSRKRKSDLPPPHELLASPNFKLYLYSCKLCTFKCNAIKEMSAHKAEEHSNANRVRGGPGRGTSATLQCARCPFRAGTNSHLIKHIQEAHSKQSGAVQLNTEEVEAADVLVCGACGFESCSKSLFRIHIEDEHGATTC